MNYEMRKIKEIGRVVTGKTPKTAISDYYNGEIMFITPTELHGNFMISNSARTLTEKGFESIKTNTISGISILVGCIGWDMGNVAMCDRRCATNQQINSVTDIKDDINPYYIYYWLKMKKDYLFSIASVTRTPILSKSAFEEIEIPVPQKEVQDAIVNVLKIIDEKIANNNKINDNLHLQMSQLYNYWFEQNHNWQNKCNGTIVDLCSINSGYPFQSETYCASGKYRLITIKNVQDNGLNLDVDNYIEDLPSDLPSYCRLKRGDILMSLTGNVGRVAINYGNNCLLNQRVACIVPSDRDNLPFLYCFLKSDRMRIKMESIATGTSQKNLSPIEMENLNISYDLTTINKFSTVAQPYYEELINNYVENMKLSSFRDWLLPMLMNGQATISD